MDKEFTQTHVVRTSMMPLAVYTGLLLSRN